MRMTNRVAPAEPAEWFPYMRFARGPVPSLPFNLTQSGMPAADVDVFADLPPLDLSHALARELPEVRERIAARYGAGADRVFVTAGASGAMSVAASALFRPGARVAVETPSYEPLRALPRRAGSEVREVERHPRDGWAIDVGRVERELAGARVGHVSITTPNNPTGARTPAADLVRLAEIAARCRGVLLSNETYEEFVPPELAVRAARLAPNAISLGTLTKAYGLGALRVGWIVLGEGLGALRSEFTDALYLDCVDIPTLSLRAARTALDRLTRLREPLERLERDSKPLFRKWLESHVRLRGRVSEHGLVTFVEVPGVDDTLALGRHLADTEQLGVVPGEFFGRAGFLRVGFGSPPERLRESLARLDRGLANFR
jgi:aspartate/methionine/tyrosine aminotransferase